MNKNDNSVINAEARKEEEIHKLIVGTFNTPLGVKLMKHLKKKLINRPSYVIGMSLDQVAFREGQKDVVTQLLKEL